ncbi:MAG: glycosyltransferase [Deltaproteobacteria bacterium]|nr:glycosyltransferase [Deltaproteobacteria bacterium]
MKVLHVLSGRERAGIRSYMLTLAHELRKKDGTELCFALLKKGAMAKTLDDDGLRVFIIEKGFTLNLFTVIRLARLIRREGIDIVHTHNVTGNFYGRLAAFLAGSKPVVTTVHADIFEEHLSSFGSRLIGKAVAGFDLKMSALTTIFITISDHLKAIVVKKGISPHKVITVHNAVAIGEACVKEKGEETVIGTVGRLVPLKNHRMFIDAAEVVIKKGFKARFLIVGDGISRQGLEGYVRSKGLSDDIVFTGWCDDMKRLYQGMDIYVACPISEGFGLTVLEAMVFSLPVIATRVGGLPEVVRDDTGIMVRSGDIEGLAEAMVRLLENPVEARLMGKKGRRLLEEEFSSQVFADRVYEVYCSGSNRKTLPGV